MKSFVVNGVKYTRLDDVPVDTVSTEVWKKTLEDENYDLSYIKGRYAVKDLFMNGSEAVYESEFLGDFDISEIDKKVKQYGFTHIILYSERNWRIYGKH